MPTIGDEAMEALRRGWYLGEEGFKDKLLGLPDKASDKLLSSGETVSPYHLEAGIAACHCLAADEAATGWPRILSLYDQLLLLKPGPVVAMNRCVALARVHGPRKAL